MRSSAWTATFIGLSSYAVPSYALGVTVAGYDIPAAPIAAVAGVVGGASVASFIAYFVTRSAIRDAQSERDELQAIIEAMMEKPVVTGAHVAQGTPNYLLHSETDYLVTPRRQLSSLPGFDGLDSPIMPSQAFSADAINTMPPVSDPFPTPEPEAPVHAPVNPLAQNDFLRSISFDEPMSEAPSSSQPASFASSMADETVPDIESLRNLVARAQALKDAQAAAQARVEAIAKAEEEAAAQAALEAAMASGAHFKDPFAAESPVDEVEDVSVDSQEEWDEEASRETTELPRTPRQPVISLEDTGPLIRSTFDIPLPEIDDEFFTRDTSQFPAQTAEATIPETTSQSPYEVPADVPAADAPKGFRERMRARAEGVAAILSERLGPDGLGATFAEYIHPEAVMADLPVIERADGSVADMGTSFWTNETFEHRRRLQSIPTIDMSHPEDEIQDAVWDPHPEEKDSFPSPVAPMAERAHSEMEPHAAANSDQETVEDVLPSLENWTPDETPVERPRARSPLTAVPLGRRNRRSDVRRQVVTMAEPSPTIPAAHSDLDAWESSLEAMDVRFDDNLMNGDTSVFDGFVDIVGGTDSLDEPEGAEPATQALPFRVRSRVATDTDTGHFQVIEGGTGSQSIAV